jgi:hypothetical protein
MERQFVATSKNGKKVFVDLEDSHAATHIADTPGLLELVKELIEQLEIDEEELAIERDMGRVIGESQLVHVQPGDDVVYAKRRNRDKFAKFVKGKNPGPCRKLVAIFRKSDYGYELWSAWIGVLGEPFPGDEKETPQSRTYWSTRALVWGTQEIQPGTETTIEPW